MLLRARGYGCFLFLASIYFFLVLVIYLRAGRGNIGYDIDSFGYERIAYSFYHDSFLGDPRSPTHVPLQPLGYACFLGCLYKIVGYVPAMIVGVQVFLAFFCTVLIWMISHCLFGSTISLIAFFLSVINVGFLTYPHFLLSETLVVAFILCFWFFFVYKRYAYAGLFLGLSMLIKSTLLLFIPVCVFTLLLCVQKNKMRVVFSFLSMVYAPILLYMWYNYYHWGSFRLAPLASLNIYQVFFSKVLSRLYGNEPSFYSHSTLAFQGKNYFDESGWTYARDLFFSTLHEHPWTVIEVWMQNVCKSTFGLLSTQLKILFNQALAGGSCSFFLTKGTLVNRLMNYAFFGVQDAVLWLFVLYELLWSIMRIPFIAVGLWCAAYKIERSTFFLIIFYIVQSLLITGCDGCTRYRLVVEPFLIIFAAIGLWVAWQKHSFTFWWPEKRNSNSTS